MKFGGSCLDKPDDIRHMVKIIKSHEKQRPKVVLSALRGVTDQLIAQAQSAKGGNFNIEPIEAKHQQLVDDLPSNARRAVEGRISELLKELRNILTGASYLKELSPSAFDKIATFGERLVIYVASGYMGEEKLKGVPLSGLEAGILTNSNFGNAAILDESVPLIRKRVGAAHVPVIAGYFGQDEAGRIATLGRGASDYIASYIASALGCETILYKDVDGIMTADPKIVKNAKLVSKIDYQTAIEVARYGSKVIFEKAIHPAMKKNLTIRVTSFADPGKGTLVSQEGKAGIVSCLKGIAIIDILDLPGLDSVASIFRGFSAVDNDDTLIAARVSRNAMSLISAERCVDKIVALTKAASDSARVEVRKDLGLVAAFGAAELEMSEVHEMLRMEKIRHQAVVEGSARRSVLVAVDLNDLERTARVLHDRLVSTTAV